MDGEDPDFSKKKQDHMSENITSPEGAGFRPEEPGTGGFFDDVLEATGEDYEDEEDTEILRRRPVWLRAVAFLTILAFLGLVAATSFPPQKVRLLDLVLNSFKLQEDIDDSLMRAVVQINIISPKQGVPLAAEQKSGTGFNIDPRGVIITNHHVIEGALNIAVTFPDGKTYRASRCSSRPEYDLAMIILEAEGLPVVPLNASGQPARGDKIRVVGNPLTLNNIVVEGKVERYLHLGSKPDRVFSIDAPIYPGNSGSPVFDRNGEVVGVVFGIFHSSENDKEKIFGLVIPIREVLDLSRVDS
jgi:S1-C subfamily serine protease